MRRLVFLPIRLLSEELTDGYPVSGHPLFDMFIAAQKSLDGRVTRKWWQLVAADPIVELLDSNANGAGGESLVTFPFIAPEAKLGGQIEEVGWLPWLGICGGGGERWHGLGPGQGEYG